MNFKKSNNLSESRIQITLFDFKNFQDIKRKENAIRMTSSCDLLQKTLVIFLVGVFFFCGFFFAPSGGKNPCLKTYENKYKYYKKTHKFT